MTKVWLACGVTDMRKGIDGLAVLVQQLREQSPHSGALFAFRGKRGHLIKLTARLPVPPARRDARGMTAKASVSFPSGWTRAASSGR
jgi:IS66 Orf2 like protein